MDLRLLFLLLVLLGLLVGGAHVHGRALDALALGGADHWRIHAHDISVVVLENRRRQLDDTLHKRGLNQLEVELAGPIVGENSAFVIKLQLEVVLGAEGLREDGLGHERAHVVIVASMLTVEARARRLHALVRNLELQNHLLRLVRSTKEKALLAMAAMNGVLAPALVDLDLRLVGDDERASVLALRVVHVHHQVGRLTGNVEVFAHGDLHVGCLGRDQSDLLLKWDSYVELRVIDDGLHWRYVHALAVTDLTFAPSIVQKLGVDHHKLCLEEPSQLCSDLSPALCEVESLREVCWWHKLELYLGVAKGANILLEALQELDFFPCAQFLFVFVPLPLVSVVDLLAHVDELELELDAVRGNRLLRVNVDLTSNWVVGIKRPQIAIEVDGKAGAL